ncbi:unnamed protein product [Paramecium sonneborni]|uniref:Uncharacterized protein n=1 Tax=Paramecium sonneborni TaxID=65129 RepID=A0A8S1RRR6_9CILI|nr:unnamed protein product [Paramecium sonneborni]
MIINHHHTFILCPYECQIFNMLCTIDDKCKKIKQVVKIKNKYKWIFGLDGYCLWIENKIYVAKKHLVEAQKCQQIHHNLHLILVYNQILFHFALKQIQVMVALKKLMETEQKLSLECKNFNILGLFISQRYICYKICYRVIHKFLLQPINGLYKTQNCLFIHSRQMC